MLWFKLTAGTYPKSQKKTSKTTKKRRPSSAAVYLANAGFNNMNIYHKYLKTSHFQRKIMGWSTTPRGSPNHLTHLNQTPHCSVFCLQKFVLLVVFRAIPVAHPTQLEGLPEVLLKKSTKRDPNPQKNNTSKLETWEKHVEYHLQVACFEERYFAGEF